MFGITAAGPTLYPASWMDSKHSSPGKSNQIAFSRVSIMGPRPLLPSEWKTKIKPNQKQLREDVARATAFVQCQACGFFYGLPMALVSPGATRQSPLYHLAIIYPGLFCVSAHLCLHHTWPLAFSLAQLQRRESGGMGWGDIYRERRNGLSAARGPRLLRSPALKIAWNGFLGCVPEARLRDEA